MLFHSSLHLGGTYTEKEENSASVCHMEFSLAIKVILKKHRFTTKLKSEEETDW